MKNTLNNFERFETLEELYERLSQLEDEKSALLDAIEYYTDDMEKVVEQFNEAFENAKEKNIKCYVVVEDEWDNEEEIEVNMATLVEALDSRELKIYFEDAR